MKILKYLLLSIGLFLLLGTAALIAILCNGIVGPLDESIRTIKVLKTGKIDTLYIYTTSYDVGNTVRVFRTGGHFGDAKDILNSTTGKTQKAIIVE
jgi:hypothetical protein